LIDETPEEVNRHATLGQWAKVRAINLLMKPGVRHVQVAEMVTRKGKGDWS